MRGHIDKCTRSEISGWAIGDSSQTAEITIEVDSRVLFTVSADRYRKDLNANCGFYHKFDEILASVQQIRAYFKGTGTELDNSPLEFNFQLEALTAEDIAWSKTVQLPTEDQMKLIGSNTPDIFISQGTRMAKVISNNIIEFFGTISREARVLDFGCGVGRVLLPITSRLNVTWFGCDVNEIAILYLQRAVPNVKAFATAYNPPLPFQDNFFDCVFSISIWTHLPIGMQLPWLKEIQRIIKPGGLALISTSGGHVVEVRRKRKDSGWTELTSDDLQKAGIIYRPYNYGGLAGIDGSYGLSAHDPKFIERVWSEIMPVLTTRERAIEAMQDLHVMTKI